VLLSERVAWILKDSYSSSKLVQDADIHFILLEHAHYTMNNTVHKKVNRCMHIISSHYRSDNCFFSLKTISSFKGTVQNDD